MTLISGVASGAGGPVVDETMDAFLRHVAAADAFSPEAKHFVAEQWAGRQDDGDAGAFLLEALAVLSPQFREGLDAYDDGEYATALGRLDGLSSAEDPYLSANATALAIKVLVELDRVEDASERLEAFLADTTAVDLYTFYAAEMVFIRGYIQLQTLQYDAAATTLEEMLDRFPEASSRLRVTAQQMLGEIRRRLPERMGDVVDLMAYAGRRLNLSVTGPPVQERQQRAVELLDKLIEEAEESEKGGGGGGSSGSSGGRQTPQAPMPESQLPAGGSPEVQLRAERQAQPGEVWGSMPPAQREKILQTLRDSFPSRYRQLVEQYYQELAKQP